MILAAAAAVAFATPSREALIERWLRANRTHSAARLESASGVPSSQSAPAPPDLHALAQRELGIPGRYRLTESPPAPVTEPWWSGPWRWISDRWSQFWHAIFGRVHVGKEAAVRIGDVLLVIVGLLLLFTALRLLRNLQFARSTSRANASPLETPPDLHSLYRDACDAASRGEYGTAALLLFAATIALLDGRGAVEVHRSTTVGDLRRELRAHDAALIAPFDAVVAPFVQRAYAERSVDEPQWHRARTAFDTMSCHPERSAVGAESKG